MSGPVRAGPGARPHGDRRAERGSGTALVLGVVGAVAVVLLALAALAQAQAGRGRAQTGADLAAIAAATALRDGWDACTVAHETAARNAVRVVACTAAGDGSVRVDVVSGPAVEAFGVALGETSAAARAGPATARDG
ncbi:Rv3654c family TadE-like protein [Cellulosimicrobium marinum]|uniref:Rv3654c family TadE-like protein n=1 Tax=Cellulosimicrobium marinum TaxID=1638992 RepID=UPI001E4928FF|nr:Rv3654c family TadE-like protein [Cellulosimicrobium marinum]MCB7135255.1 histidine kinase [Cellulosimicrobium marinum]